MCQQVKALRVNIKEEEKRIAASFIANNVANSVLANSAVQAGAARGRLDAQDDLTDEEQDDDPSNDESDSWSPPPPPAQTPSL